MPHFSAFKFLCSAALGAALSLAAAPATQAQTFPNPPAWSGAAALGARNEFPAFIRVDAAGNTYELNGFLNTTQIAGATLTSQGGVDVYLAKYTPTGALAWVRQLGALGDESIGGLALDATGNVYVSGTFTGPISLGGGLSLASGTASGTASGLVARMFVVRYSPQGTPEWAQYTTNPATERVSGGGLGLDASGHVYAAGLALRSVTLGATTLSGPTPSVFLAKLSGPSGALQSLTTAFAYAALTSGFPFYYPPQLAVAPAGEVYLYSQFEQPPVFGTTTLTSRSTQNALMARYTATGAFDWVRQLSSTGEVFILDACTDAAGGLYLAGAFRAPANFASVALPHRGDSDGFLFRCSAQGTVDWGLTLGSADFDVLTGLALDAAGNVYVTGSFNGSAQFSTRALSSSGGNDVLVGAFSPQGLLRWTQQAGGPGYDSGVALGLDGAGNLRVLGRAAANSVFGSLPLNSTATNETFLARLDNAILGTYPAAAAEPLALYPNPAHDQLHLPALPAGTPVQFLDALGRVARTTPVAAGRVSVRGLTAGLYQLRATDAQGRRYAGRVLVH